MGVDLTKLDKKVTIAAGAALVAVLMAHMSKRKVNQQRVSVGLPEQHPAYLKTFAITFALVYAAAYFWGPSSKSVVKSTRGQVGGGGGLVDIEEVMRHIDMGEPDF